MNDPFVQLDPQVISRELRLQERGVEQGTLNLPPSDTAALDNIEGKIVIRVAEHYSQAQIETTNSIRTYDQRLSELALLSRLSSIRMEAMRAASDFNAEVSNRMNRLSNSADAVASSYDELRQFRAENLLKRPAHAVPPTVTTVGAIALAWLAETTVNAFLLRQNDAMGYLGGVIAAAVIGALNVLVAAFVGRYVWPRKNLKSAASRTIAWFGIALWLVFLLVWNLLAGHFRDAKARGLPDPEEAALQMMGSGLDSIYSWGLLVAGIIFAVSAAMAAYRMDDPYPGYGDVTRRHNTRCEDYADEIQLATDELLAIRNDAIDAATSVRQELERQFAEHNQILTAREAYARRYEEFAVQLEQAANALLQEYRAANRSRRSTPEPAHFKNSWLLPRAVLPPSAPVRLRHEDIAEAESALDEAVAQIIGAFDATIARFEPLDALKRRLTDV